MNKKLFHQYSSWEFDWSLSLKLILAFILFTVVGTLSHELGHWFVAEVLGMDATINYYSTHFISIGEDRVRLLIKDRAYSYIVWRSFANDACW